jgi:glycosyltransferase involved in cell wall biosynthesis
MSSASNGHSDANGVSSRYQASRLRIAQVAPLYERLPPRLYGGTERVASYITEELVRRGHDVTLFASGDSLTTAKLVAGSPQALRLADQLEYGTFLHLPMLSDVYEGAADRFDIIHSHVDYWSFPFARLSRVPTVATMHGRLNVQQLQPVYSRYRSVPLVSISDSQRKPLPFMNWAATIYHGLPRDLLRFSPQPGKYLAFLGRISPEKGPDLAIEVARRVGIPLKIAAKVDKVDNDYYLSQIKPKLSPPDVEYIGEISESEKSDFLGGAIALLFTIEWPEPFGLAMIEAMACGTPVIARPYGSVPEIVSPGISGFVESGIPDLAAAVARVETLSRVKCREEFERRFTVEAMIDNYERVYRRLIDRGGNVSAKDGLMDAPDSE